LLDIIFHLIDLSNYGKAEGGSRRLA